MKHSGPIFVIGIVLVIMPLLGFPTVWKNFVIFIFGIYLCGVVLVRLKRPMVNKISNKNKSRASAETQTLPESTKATPSLDLHDQPPQA